MSARVNDAEELFKEGFVCSQAVFAAFSDMFGVDKNNALRLASGFGAGIARKQEVCGAVSGAIMLIGMKYGKTSGKDLEAHEKTYEVVDCFCSKFIERNKSINCYELLGCDISTANANGLIKKLCPKYVKDSAEIISELLKV